MARGKYNSHKKVKYIFNVHVKWSVWQFIVVMLMNELLYLWQGELEGLLRIPNSFIFMCITLHECVMEEKIVIYFSLSLWVICV